MPLFDLGESEEKAFDPISPTAVRSGDYLADIIGNAPPVPGKTEIRRVQSIVASESGALAISNAQDTQHQTQHAA